MGEYILMHKNIEVALIYLDEDDANSKIYINIFSSNITI